MLPRALVAFLVAAEAVVTAGSAIPPDPQRAVIYLNEPTLIGASVVQGPVLFVHDAAKMARGEPCTTVWIFEPGTGPAERLVSFHCTPRAARIVSTFTIRTQPNLSLGFGCILTAYQFVGETEEHGVPVPVVAQ